MTFLKFVAAWLLTASICIAQVEVKSGTYYQVDGLGKVTQVGDLTLVAAPPTITVKPVGIIRVETEAANIEVSISDSSRVPFDAAKLDDKTWVINKPGRWWIDVTAIDFEKNIYGRKQAVIDVGEAPEPGPGPTPPPSPTGPFDGLASKVRVHATYLPAEHRAKIASVCTTAAAQMRSFHFKQSSQATAYIKQNWPQCVNEHCSAIWSLLIEDSAARNLGWQEIQAYYTEVAKGVQ